jgi:hypothetical protein
VGHRPRGVDGVAREAAADVVVDAAAGHGAQREQRHLRLGARRVVAAGGAAQEQFERRVRRELRRAAEAPLNAVELAPERRDRLVERRGAQRLVRRAQQRAARQPARHPAALLADLLATVGPGARDRLEHLREAGHAVARLGREVRAAVERHLLGREEHVQRPAAVAGHRLHGLHVESVDVRALLAVDLDVHEVLVHERGDARVLEALALHDVAPVAGRVADGHQQRALLLARAAQRLLAPRQPVDRVVAVLQEVGGGLAGEGVGHGDHHGACRWRVSANARAASGSGARAAGGAGPRWSKTSRSRAASAGAITSAKPVGQRQGGLARAAGQGDDGGGRGVGGRPHGLACSVTVSARPSAPLRSSGTARAPHS